MDTHQHAEEIFKYCKDLFLAKNRDYGTSWRILRPSSLTDQIYIKARRIRQIQEAGEQLVEDDIALDFVGIINYSVMALLQLELAKAGPVEELDTSLELSSTKLSQLYNQQQAHILQLLRAKNHDYGEAWRDLRVSSIVDLMLMKLLRLRKMEGNNGQTEVSEGLDANYMDLVNYSIFALIHLEFLKETTAKS